MTALHQLFFLLKPYRWQVVLAIFLTLLPAYFTVWNPLLIGRLIDEGIIGGSTQALWIFALMVLFSKSCLFFANTFVTYCLSAFGLQILVDYRDHLLQKILHYPVSFFDHMASGKLTTRLTSDINSLQELFSAALVPLIGNVFLILGVMIGMLLLNWRLAVLSFLVLPLLIWLVAVFHVRIRRRFGFMRQSLATLNAFSAESFSGSRDIQVFGARALNDAEFSALSHRLQRRNLEAVREFGTINPLVPFITALMNVMILSYGGWQVIHGQMTVGSVVAFLAYASHFEWPIRDFAEKYSVFQQAMASVDRLVEIARYDSEPNNGKEIFSGEASVQFKNVTFTYERDSGAAEPRPAVNDLCFEAKPGEKIALLGETGSGKTTTCSLLMRFYEPSSGEIRIDGRNISNISLDSLRSQIGWISQDVILFSTTLRENIRFYDQSISDGDIWKVLELVQLKEWVEDLPKQLDEKLSERASSLSSGQRQLISLARALVKKPKILIFDEATSYVDSQTEWMLQQAVDHLWASDSFRSVTGFFIAHRLSTLRKCNRMLAFKNGRIVESGTYRELLAQKGYAAQLYEEQFRKRA